MWGQPSSHCCHRASVLPWETELPPRTKIMGSFPENNEYNDSQDPSVPINPASAGAKLCLSFFSFLSVQKKVYAANETKVAI